jgi:hypothetical protein
MNCFVRGEGKGAIIDKEELELKSEDEIFDTLAVDDEDEDVADAALLVEDEEEDEFVADSVDVDDLATGFDATISTREIDVDEDIQGDEGSDTTGQVLLTPLEVDGTVPDAVRGDEIERDLDDALANGTTSTKAPSTD